MRTFAKHFTQGYVGKIKEVGTTLKISISSSYRQRNQNGDYEDRTYWNTVTVFDEKRMKFIRDHVSEGDLDLHRFCSGHVLMLGGPLFEGHW